MDLALSALSWVLKYGAGKVADRVLFPNQETRKALDKNIATWLAELPKEMMLTHPDPLFSSDRDQAGPRQQALWQALEAERLPEVHELHDALIEQWHARREALGQQAQPFFKAPERQVRERLYTLAATLRACLDVDPRFFMREMLRRTEARADEPTGARSVSQWIDNRGAKIGLMQNIRGDAHITIGSVPKVPK